MSHKNIFKAGSICLNYGSSWVLVPWSSLAGVVVLAIRISSSSGALPKMVIELKIFFENYLSCSRLLSEIKKLIQAIFHPKPRL